MRPFSRAIRMAPALGALASVLTAQVPVREHRLANGLQLLLVQRRDARTVEVSAGYFVGAVDDSLRGTAHLMEHLAMRETRAGGGLAARYPRLGIDGGAVTTDRTTLFGMSGKADLAMLDTLLSLQRQRMRELALSDVGVATERRSVHTEVDGRRPETPWLTTLFPGHRLQRAGGDHRDLDRITPDALRRFYARYYAPGNAVLVITSPWPDSLVMARATSAFAGVAAGGLMARPVDRDSTPIRARRWSGRLPSGEYGLAVAVPGLQHPWATLLEAVVRRADAEGRRGGPLVTVALRGPVAPARVLVLSTRDTLDAAGRLDAAWRRLLTLVDSVPAPSTDPAHDLFDCDAAGDWRYCIADDSIPGAARRGLAALLASSTSAEPAQLWPSPRRTPPATPTRAEAAPVAPRRWTPPASAPIAWSTTRGGMEWVAREGGDADTVFIAFVIAPATATPTIGEVAALELMGKSWTTWRDRSGARVDSLLDARGVRVTARPLPFPTLASSEEFRSLGDRPTPIGLYGLEFRVAVPREHAGAALTLIGDALRAGHADTAAFQALRAQQLRLLSMQDTLSRPTVEVVSRQRALVARGAEGHRFAPADAARRLEAIRALDPAALEASARMLVTRGLGRMVILGAEEGSVAGWLAESGLDALGALRWPSAAPSCGSPDTTTTTIRVGPPQPQTRLIAFSCAPREVDAAAVVANAVMGGSEDALLARRLRTELGMAYTFRSQLTPVWGPPLGIWTLDIDTPTATADSAVREIRAVLQRAQASGPSAEQLDQAKAILARRLRDAGGEGMSWVSGVFWKERTAEEDAALIERVTIVEVREALAAWWRPEAARVVRTAGTR